MRHINRTRNLHSVSSFLSLQMYTNDWKVMMTLATSMRKELEDNNLVDYEESYKINEMIYDNQWFQLASYVVDELLPKLREQDKKAESRANALDCAFCF